MPGVDLLFGPRDGLLVKGGNPFTIGGTEPLSGGMPFVMGGNVLVMGVTGLLKGGAEFTSGGTPLGGTLRPKRLVGNEDPTCPSDARGSTSAATKIMSSFRINKLG